MGRRRQRTKIYTAPTTNEPFIDLCDDVAFEPDLFMECLEDALSEKQLQAQADEQRAYDLAVLTIKNAREEEVKEYRQKLQREYERLEQERQKKLQEQQRKRELQRQAEIQARLQRQAEAQREAEIQREAEERRRAEILRQQQRSPSPTPIVVEPRDDIQPMDITPLDVTPVNINIQPQNPSQNLPAMRQTHPILIQQQPQTIAPTVATPGNHMQQTNVIFQAPNQSPVTISYATPSISTPSRYMLPMSTQPSSTVASPLNQHQYPSLATSLMYQMPQTSNIQIRAGTRMLSMPPSFGVTSVPSPHSHSMALPQPNSMPLPQFSPRNRPRAALPMPKTVPLQTSAVSSNKSYPHLMEPVSSLPDFLNVAPIDITPRDDFSANVDNVVAKEPEESTGLLSVKAKAILNGFYKVDVGQSGTYVNNFSGDLLFKCPECDAYCPNNWMAIEHVVSHMTAVRDSQLQLELENFTRCKHCLKKFSTPFLMQTHIEMYHNTTYSSPLRCQICDKNSKNEKALLSHVDAIHSSHRMPYVCHLCQYRSFNLQNTLDHFKKDHLNSSYLQCPICLQIFNPRNLTSGTRSLATFFKHIMSHNIASQSHPCKGCKLRFSSKQLLSAHIQQIQGSKPAVRSSEKQPPAKSNSDRKARSSNLTSLNAPEVTKSKSYKGLVVVGEDAKDKCCSECSCLLSYPEHFVQYRQCTSCRYATTCASAYTKHMAAFHLGQKHYLKRLLPKERPNKRGKMTCLCGYSTIFGNKMGLILLMSNVLNLIHPFT